MLKKSTFLLFLLYTFLFSGENSYLQNNGEEVQISQDKTIIIYDDEDDAKLPTYLQ
jgi:hypothetical protein